MPSIPNPIKIKAAVDITPENTGVGLALHGLNILLGSMVLTCSIQPRETHRALLLMASCCHDR